MNDLIGLSHPAARQATSRSHLSDKLDMATLSIDVLARLARAAQRAGDWYALARVLPVLIESSPRNKEWLGAYVRLLVQLGLCAAAAEVVASLEPGGGGDQTPMPTPSAASGGKVAWSSRRRRFDANLAALRERDPDVAARVAEAWGRHGDTLELHLTNDGNAQVKPRGAIWPPAWRPALDNHRNLASTDERFAKPAFPPPPFIFAGLGLGWGFLAAWKQSHRVFLGASSTLYVVEPRAELLAVAMHIHDLREPFADPRVRWFVGPDAVETFRALLEGDGAWPMSDRIVAESLDERPPLGPLRDAMAGVAVRRQQQAAALHDQIRRRYGQREAAFWASRFASVNDASHRAHDGSTDPNQQGPGRAPVAPLRILGVTSRHTTFLQYSMRDCLKALETLGHHTRLVIEPSDHQPLDAISTLSAQLDFEPDVVLLLSRMRYEMTAFVHPSIPSLTWDQDALPWVFDAGRSPKLEWNDFLMGFSADVGRRRFGWPAHRCTWCAMAGSPDTYSAEPLPEDDLAPYRCDASYVSHASATVEQERVAVEAWLANEKLRSIYRRLVESFMDSWRGGGAFPSPIRAPLLDFCRREGLELSRDEAQCIVQALQRVGDRAFRHAALEWVADWADRSGRSFHVYGNGWDRHPRLSRFARGPTRNGHELRCVYQASSVNLQLMGFGFVHQRALDGLMAGGFFLARRCACDDHGPATHELAELLERHGAGAWDELSRRAAPDVVRRVAELMTALHWDPRVLHEYSVEQVLAAARSPFAPEIIPDFDAITFDGPESFVSRVEFFLARPDERRRLALAMREAVVERFSYVSRMSQMLRFLRDGFAQEAANSARDSGVLRVLGGAPTMGASDVLAPQEIRAPQPIGFLST